MSVFPTTFPAPPGPGARSRWMHWAPVLLLVVDLVLETAAPNMVAAGFPLTLLPVVAAFTLGPWVVGGATVVTLGLQLALADRVGHLTEQHHLWVYVATALAGVLGAALAAQRRRQSRDLVRVRTVAETLQRAVLRPVPGRTGALRAAGFYHPAEADAGVGGDLYEVCETRFGTRVLLGDVRGKGLDAVRTVADVLGAFRTAAHETADLTALAAQLDRQVARHAAETGDHELFVTAVLVEHQPATGRVAVVNRGHLDPLLIRDSGVEPVACPARLPLGLGALGLDTPGLGTPTGPEADASQTTVRALHPGETLLLVTDGITEARDEEGAFYPLAARLETLGPRDPRAVIDHLGRDVPAFAAELGDDLTALALAPVFGPDALVVRTDEARLVAGGGVAHAQQPEVSA
ncbi:PP2C family protein-serine/threonine phosphatase [Streptacidiphilus anmyonensis]|uniref:PP2C family protein-serine/threonine phosphatase n=1 Tax=Streptacidiphilus anmyonensis TaxID=405782 RepID=UPI000B1B668F|nr:PP2C family protein-serine/threonine phosphatase [Streptacidiphilus anmyonensis]